MYVKERPRIDSLVWRAEGVVGGLLLQANKWPLVLFFLVFFWNKDEALGLTSFYLVSIVAKVQKWYAVCLNKHILRSRLYLSGKPSFFLVPNYYLSVWYSSIRAKSPFIYRYYFLFSLVIHSFRVGVILVNVTFRVKAEMYRRNSIDMGLIDEPIPTFPTRDGCFARVPYASVMAFVMCVIGVILFAIMMVWSFNASIEQARRALDIDNIPWLDKVG